MRLLALLLLTPALFAAPVFASETPPDPAKVEQGRKVYQQFCSVCHGVGMKNPIEGAANLSLYPNDQFTKWKEIVSKGKGDMPAWEEILREQEFDEIWYYIASRAGTETIPEQAGDGTQSAENSAETEFLLAHAEGSGPDPEVVEAGRKVYHFCSHCHGVGLVTGGSSSYDLRKFPTDEYARFKRSVANGKGDMPAWGDVLRPDEFIKLWYYISTATGTQPFPGFGDFVDSQQSAALAAPELATEGTLTACLARNGGAMSRARVNGGTGFDYGVVEEVAKRMNVDLKITWFESEKDELASPLNMTYAMLAYGLCDVAPAHPIAMRTSGPPRTPRSLLPYWDERPDIWDIKFQVDLKPVSVTQPYMFAGLGVVLGPDSGKDDVTRLTDLKGLKVGVQQGTLAEAILRREAPSSVQPNVVTVRPTPKFLWDMELGNFDAALVDVAAYDFHKRQNSITKLRLASYRHALGMNIGMAVLEERPGLQAALNAALGDMLTDGAMLEIAKTQKTHFMAPDPDAPMDLGRAVRALGQ